MKQAKKDIGQHFNRDGQKSFPKNYSLPTLLVEEYGLQDESLDHCGK